MLCTKCGATFDNPNNLCPECGTKFEAIPAIRSQQGPENTRFAGVQAGGEVIGRMVDAKYRRGEKKGTLPNWLWGVIAIAIGVAGCGLISLLFKLIYG